ncbi:MAG TPA: S1 RNA-binding domain-containing protein [Patescibacteria group bacterium]|nr:S1 RNA-binding domain-containing protein [Patescibacteria group bacterium]
MDIQMVAGLSMKDLLAATNVELPKMGSLVEGTILSVSKNAIMVDLGSLGTGIVYPGEFYDNTTLQRSLVPGIHIGAVFLSIEDEGGMGYRELSLRRAQRTTAWEDIKQKKESGEIITTKIVNINKGGLIVELNGVQGFLPLSQLSSEHYPKVEGGDTAKIVQALQKFRNQDFQVKIIDFSEDENRLIVSEKAISEASLQEELAKFSVGDVVTGIITDVTDFGAFVMLKAKTENSDAQIEGLIHISEIDWKIIDNPRNILTTGQEVQAKVISVEGGKISLSLKALKSDPWEHALEKYSVGQTISGKVVKITNYGALVSLDEEITGLVPLSEFGDNKPSEVVTIGAQQLVAIVSLDPKEHKMLLTLQK